MINLKEYVLDKILEGSEKLILENCLNDESFKLLINIIFTYKNKITSIILINNNLSDQTITYINNKLRFFIAIHLEIIGNDFSKMISDKIPMYCYIKYMYKGSIIIVNGSMMNIDFSNFLELRKNKKCIKCLEITEEKCTCNKNAKKRCKYDIDDVFVHEIDNDDLLKKYERAKNLVLEFEKMCKSHPNMSAIDLYNVVKEYSKRS